MGKKEKKEKKRNIVHFDLKRTRPGLHLGSANLQSEEILKGEVVMLWFLVFRTTRHLKKAKFLILPQIQMADLLHYPIISTHMYFLPVTIELCFYSKSEECRRFCHLGRAIMIIFWFFACGYTVKPLLHCVNLIVS